MYHASPSRLPFFGDVRVQLERSHSGQIAELEERIDFAERLLTERREQMGPS